jgi:hypothetical protein
MGNMITTGHPWQLQVSESLHMKHQIAGEHGRLMDKMDGTLAQPYNTIDVTQCALPKQEVKGW